MILDKIVRTKKQKLIRSKAKLPLAKLKSMVAEMDLGKGFPFEENLALPGVNFICEIKKASPSKGIIAEEFPYLEIAKDYELAGAAAISVLTEEDYFKGSLLYLKEVAREVNLPVLRKDFIFDEYQIYEAKLYGAAAILLIAGILTEEEIRRFIKLADSLKLSCLVEAHNGEEVIKAIQAGARVIGVNNRDLKTFEVDINNSIKLRDLVPGEISFVSESGISSRENIEVLEKADVNGALIGESLMSSENKIRKLQSLNKDNKDLKVKFCGIRTEESIKWINELRPDYIGFVFAKSPRQISLEQGVVLRKALDKGIKAVGVFVEGKIDELIEAVKLINLDVIQIHGAVDNKYIEELRLRLKQENLSRVKIWQGIAVKNMADLKSIEESLADEVVVDTFVPGILGGSGKQGNWHLISKIERKIILAGGLNSKNLLRGIRNLHPWLVDLSSGLESTKGIKDRAKMVEIMNLLKINRGE